MANHITALFDKAAQWTSKQSGHAQTFALAILVVVVWAVSGPLFQFSDTWQLVINTGTSLWLRSCLPEPYQHRRLPARLPDIGPMERDATQSAAFVDRVLEVCFVLQVIVECPPADASLRSLPSWLWWCSRSRTHEGSVGRFRGAFIAV